MSNLCREKESSYPHHCSRTRPYWLWCLEGDGYQQKTEQTLEAAKLAIEHPQKADRDRFKPKFGEAAGILEIPKIHAELPIVEGTDADDLEKGVGHYKGSYYPNDNGQIVLSGHRDTVFRRTGELKEGIN